MFERVISQSIQTITTQTLRERSLISLVEILEDERIPTRLKPFFETEVRWWLYNERLARQANKRFDYDNPELASLLTYLEQVQFRHARFEREDFLTVLDSAVKLTYNYLCRPQTTLKWYIFRGQPVMPLREVMLRFGAFLDYPYFSTVFNDWVERKQDERPTFDGISASEFERVIRRIDDQILLNCTVEDLLGIINPIFEFVGEGEQMLVPVDALIIYFDDKNIKRLVDFLEQVRGTGRDLVGREDFVALLDELLSTAEEEPEADFSDVYQNDELDDVVRRHIESGTAPVTPANEAVPQEESRLTEENWHAEPPYQPSVETGEFDGGEDGGGEPMVDIPEEEDTTATGWIDPEDHRRFTEAFGSVVTDQNAEVDTADAVEYSVDQEDMTPVGDGGAGEQMDTSSEYPDVDTTSEDLATAPEESPAVSDELPDEYVEDDVTIADEVEEPQTDEIASEKLATDETDAREAGTANDDGISANDAVEVHENNVEEVNAADEEEEMEESASGALNDSGYDNGTEPDMEPETEPVSSESRIGNEVVENVRDTVNPSTASSSFSRDSADTATATSHLADHNLLMDTGSDEPARELEDVRRFITPMLERKILKRVFNRDREQYEAALDQLNSTTTWRAASQILDEVFIRFDVDPYSRTAIRFTDSIYGRYLPRN